MASPFSSSSVMRPVGAGEAGAFFSAPRDFLFRVSARNVFKGKIYPSLLVNVFYPNGYDVSYIFYISYFFHVPRSKFRYMNKSILAGSYLNHGAEIKQAGYPSL